MKCRSLFRELEAKGLFFWCVIHAVDRIPTEPFSTSVKPERSHQDPLEDEISSYEIFGLFCVVVVAALGQLEHSPVTAVQIMLGMTRCSLQN